MLFSRHASETKLQVPLQAPATAPAGVGTGDLLRPLPEDLPTNVANASRLQQLLQSVADHMLGFCAENGISAEEYLVAVEMVGPELRVSSYDWLLYVLTQLLTDTSRRSDIRTQAGNDAAAFRDAGTGVSGW